MEYVDILKDIKNNIISEINTNDLDYSNITNLYQKKDLDINVEYDEMSDLVGYLKRDFINMILSTLGIGIGYFSKEEIYYICIIISLYSSMLFFKDAVEYQNRVHKCTSLNNDMDMCKLEGRILKIRKELLEKELNKINLAIEFLDTLTEEEKVKYNIIKKLD